MLVPSISTFEGLTSRWTRPFACAASSASATWRQIVERAARLERALRAEQRSQVGALDVAHREVEQAVDLARVVDRHDVRMLERRRAPPRA